MSTLGQPMLLMSPAAGGRGSGGAAAGRGAGRRAERGSSRGAGGGGAGGGVRARPWLGGPGVARGDGGGAVRGGHISVGGDARGRRGGRSRRRAPRAAALGGARRRVGRAQAGGRGVRARGGAVAGASGGEGQGLTRLIPQRAGSFARAKPNQAHAPLARQERARRRELESRESARLAAEAARARKGRGVLRRLMGRGKPRAAQVPTVPGDPAAPSTEAHTAKSS